MVHGPGPFLRWKMWIAAACAALLLAGAGFYWLSHSARLAALMRADPDTVPGDADLAAFAIAYARPVYEQHCASCHGAALQGDRTRGIPALVAHQWLYGGGRVAEIERTILYGIRAGNTKTRHLADMPGFARAVPYPGYALDPLEPGDIRDVVEYLINAAGKPAEADAAERGAQIFARKGQCFDCHERDARGDDAIGAPSLVGSEWLYGTGTRQDLYDSIAGGRQGSCPAWSGTLSPVTIRALAVLVYAASHEAR